jgi:hypothetical protein
VTSPAIWESALVAALVAAVVSLATLWWNSRQARLDRQRELFARAFAAIADYREFAFIVRRRESSGVDRTTIHRDLSDVQAQLHRFEAMIRVEAPTVAESYSALTAALRRIAGAEIYKGWNHPPADSDVDMHVEDVDLTQLSTWEDAYLDAASNHLTFLRMRRSMAPRREANSKIGDRRT